MKTNTIQKQALYKVVFGITKELGLTKKELSILTGRHPSSISKWKKNGKVIPSQQVLEFVELYKDLTNLFLNANDRVSWLRDVNEGLGMKSPLELIKDDRKNLNYIRRTLHFLSGHHLKKLENMKNKLKEETAYIEDVKNQMKLKGLTEDQIKLATDPLITFSMKLKEDIEEMENLQNDK